MTVSILERLARGRVGPSHAKRFVMAQSWLNITLRQEIFPLSDFILDNPFLEFLDARLVAWKSGYAEFRMPIQARNLNRQGVLQGGAVATLLDAACGYAGVYAAEGETVIHGFTLSLTVNYLDTGLGESVTAKGFIERQGRSIFFSRGEAWVDDKLLIASAQGTFKYVGTHGKK